MSQVIIWNLNAVQQFEAAIAFVEKESKTAADKMRDVILQKIDQLLSYPEMHPADKFKINNSGSFRAFEIYHFRISYFIGKKEIRIIRMRHSSMKPKRY